MVVAICICKGIRELNAGLEKSKEGESGTASQRRDHLGWGLKTEEKGRTFKQKTWQVHVDHRS